MWRCPPSAWTNRTRRCCCQNEEPLQAFPVGCRAARGHVYGRYPSQDSEPGNDISFGSVYENAAAQELKTHGFELYYFNSKKQGKSDFLVEQQGKVLPIEIKSGKDYTKHAALNNVMTNANYVIPAAYVFHNGNVSASGRGVYYPIYMLMFLYKDKPQEDMIYRLNLDVLK